MAYNEGVSAARELPALLKHVGRGARLAKDLPRAEAAQVMGAMLDGAADPVQVGGFLIALRMKSESAEELAGFVDAMRARSVAPDLGSDPRPLVDVDLHGDGREGRPSLLLPAACLAAACGARVLLRGSFGGRFARHDLDEVYARLGVDVRAGRAAATRSLGESGVAVLDLHDVLPGAADLLELREKLGVRTCVNTCVKLLDPAGARRLLVGIFHSPYHGPVAKAARLGGALRAAVVQAPGGLPEAAPDKPVRVTLVDEDSQASPDPVALDGAAAPLPSPVCAPPPGVETAAELATLCDDVIHTPAEAAPGAARMTVLTAALMLWAAGLAPTPHDAATLARLAQTLATGRAADTLRVMRACYRS
jgi:anthranilate phosphoribosyltransferase